MKNNESITKTIINNFNNTLLCHGYKPVQPRPLHIWEDKTVWISYKWDTEIYPLDQASQSVTDLAQLEVLYIVFLNTGMAGVSPPDDHHVPCLLFDKNFHRWVGDLDIGLLREIADSAVAPTFKSDVKLVFLGIFMFHARGINLHDDIILHNLGTLNTLIWNSESVYQDALDKSAGDIMDIEIKDVLSIILKASDLLGAEIPDHRWPLKPMSKNFGDRAAVIRYFNVCGERAYPGEYAHLIADPITLGREGISPRLKWKKLGV